MTSIFQKADPKSVRLCVIRGWLIFRTFFFRQTVQNINLDHTVHRTSFQENACDFITMCRAMLEILMEPCDYLMLLTSEGRKLFPWQVYLVSTTSSVRRVLENKILGKALKLSLVISARKFIIWNFKRKCRSFRQEACSHDILKKFAEVAPLNDSKSSGRISLFLAVR